MKAAETQRAKLIDLFVHAEMAAPSSYMDWESRLQRYCLLDNGRFPRLRRWRLPSGRGLQLQKYCLLGKARLPRLRRDCLLGKVDKNWSLVALGGLLNSECSQQNRADKNKHGAYRQHIELQGKVIGLDDAKHSKLSHLAAERQRRPERAAVAG
jgi:hypothetical protein